MGGRLTVAGVGLTLLAIAGRGTDTTTGAPSLAGGETGQETSQPAGTTELPAVSGQQVCDLLSTETLARYVPEAQLGNGTVESTTTSRKAYCEAKALRVGGTKTRRLTVKVHAPPTPSATSAAVSGLCRSTTAATTCPTRTTGTASGTCRRTS